MDAVSPLLSTRTSRVFCHTSSFFWASRGHRCCPFSPPVLVFNFYRPYGSAIPLLVGFSSSAFGNNSSRSRALRKAICAHKKKSLRIYTSTCMHSGGLERTKPTYTRLEDNLIRHRCARLPVSRGLFCKGLVSRFQFTLFFSSSSRRKSQPANRDGLRSRLNIFFFAGVSSCMIRLVGSLGSLVLKREVICSPHVVDCMLSYGLRSNLFT